MVTQGFAKIYNRIILFQVGVRILGVVDLDPYQTLVKTRNQIRPLQILPSKKKTGFG